MDQKIEVDAIRAASSAGETHGADQVTTRLALENMENRGDEARDTSCERCQQEERTTNTRDLLERTRHKPLRRTLARSETPPTTRSTRRPKQGPGPRPGHTSAPRRQGVRDTCPEISGCSH